MDLLDRLVMLLREGCYATRSIYLCREKCYCNVFRSFVYIVVLVEHVNMNDNIVVFESNRCCHELKQHVIC